VEKTLQPLYQHLIFPLKHSGVSGGITVNKGVIGFSRKFEGKSLLLDKILKKNSGEISKVLGGKL
jgi:PII-like signaling protein